MTGPGKPSARAAFQRAPTPGIMVPFVATTSDVKVTVRPVHLDHQSDPLSAKYVYAYFVEVENLGADEVQLLRRHWYIRDGWGKLEEVEGEGVVGQQPVIAPGATHAYQSFCLLPTPTGTMEGTYLMERASGERFRIAIPRFHLTAMAN